MEVVEKLIVAFEIKAGRELVGNNVSGLNSFCEDNPVFHDFSAVRPMSHTEIKQLKFSHFNPATISIMAGKTLFVRRQDLLRSDPMLLR